ncbi:MAG TPA: hypothetical protein VKB38_12860 [Terracidiphilus sp.]|nr:hypothetical protein [Terracidiphilus sp.]
MHGSRIPIWFFIGLLLAVYGGMILGYGLYESTTGNFAPGVQLTELHTPVWWGALLLVLGLVYLFKYRPGKTK